MKVIKPGADRDVPRGVVGGSEISQSSTGAQNIYMAVFRVPPGTQSRPHYHENCESAVYMLSGSLRVKWGDRLEQELMLEPRDLVYVPPRETHVLENVSDTEPAEYVVARDSPLEDAVIVPWAEAPDASLPG
ncbi:MAG: cupin domain-containing protein [Solirubrobacterales bacterium]|nr:cupin domain-containing protein [Solirubrobacterales bacterium]